MENYEEKFNPYIKSFKEYNLIMGKLRSENEKLKDNLNWYESIDIEELSQDIEPKLKNIRTERKEIEKFKEEIRIKESQLNEIEKEIKSRLNPKYYFSNIQKELRRKRDSIKESICEVNSRISLRNRFIRETNNIQSKIERYNSFDPLEIPKKINNNIKKITDIEEKLQPIIDKKYEVEKQLKPIIDELKKVDSIIKKEYSILGGAEKYEKNLDNAVNDYERAKIHEECEYYLNNSRPRIIIRNQKELIKKYQRDLDKLLTRAKKISEKAIRIIDTIIIDGNNMAYENNKFIGLKALLPITLILEKDYKVIVIFDFEIKRMLKKSSQVISKEFKDSIIIHIVAPEQKADETILDLVSGKLNYYIISNDRFSDYFDKEAVKSDRVFRHEIIKNSIFIHDLDIKTVF